MLSAMKRMMVWLMLVAWCGAVWAQTFSFRTITFTGAPQYSQGELMRMSGLAVNHAYTDAELKAALGKLNDSGLFARINYRSDGASLTVELEPAEKGQARPVTYTNFVFYKPEELNAKVHALLPGFNGTVPVNGDLEQKVARALETVLKERGITATVNSIGGSGGGVDYSIASPPVVVGKVAVTGVNLGSDNRLMGIRDRVAGSDYTQGVTEEALRTNLTDAYHDLGYVNFAVGPVTHGAAEVSGGKITVDLTGSAVTGPQYTIAAVTLPAGTSRVPKEEIERANQLKVGAPASRIEVLSTQARVGQVFQSYGYLDEKTTVEPVRNDVARTVGYTVSTVTGEAYKFRALQTPGLTEEQSTAVRAAFKLPQGALYDAAALGPLNAAGFKTMCGGKPLRLGLKKDAPTREVDVMAGCGK